MNMSNYRIGDHVYVEGEPTVPYQIRKIEELNKTSDGIVEARVTIYYRRNDLTSGLIAVLDKEENMQLQEEDDGTTAKPPMTLPPSSIPKGYSQQERDQLKLCEVYPSKIQEVMPTQYIRGKCLVVPLTEHVEEPIDFLKKPNVFFFTRQYDPDKKTLKLPDKYIRVGSKWQADVPKAMSSVNDMENYELRETLRFTPYQMSNADLDLLLLMCQSVGVFGRSCLPKYERYYTASMICYFAKRSGTIHEQLVRVAHENGYDFERCLTALMRGGQPLICTDNLENWNPAEIALLIQGIHKYGKNFNTIQRELLIHKKVSSIISFFYQWKASEQHALCLQRNTIPRNNDKLKYVFVGPMPNNPTIKYKKSPNALENCDICNDTKPGDFYQMTILDKLTKLCKECWHFWKKYGGFNSLLQSPTTTTTNCEISDNKTFLVCPKESCKLVLKSPRFLRQHIECTHTEERELLLEKLHGIIGINGNDQRGGNIVKSVYASQEVQFFYKSSLEGHARRLILHNIEKKRFRRLARKPWWPLHEIDCSSNELSALQIEALCQLMEPTSSEINDDGGRSGTTCESLMNSVLSRISTSSIFDSIRDKFLASINNNNNQL